jgi:hypothetical protein
MFRWWWLVVPIPLNFSISENTIEVKVQLPIQYVLRGLDYISSVVRSSLVKSEGEINQAKPESEPTENAAHTD